MKKLTILFTVLIVFWSQQANAKVLEMFFQPQTGGMFGLYSQNKLPWGDQSRELNTDQDYFMTHQGPNAGFSTGLEFLFVDVVLDVNQFYRDGRKSTFFSLMAGFDADFQISDSSEWTLYILGGVGLATVDNAWAEKENPQVAHEDLYSQILMVRMGARYEYKFTENIRLSFDGGIGAHIMQLSFKAANDEQSQASGVHAYGMVGLRIQFNVFGSNKKEVDATKTGLPPGYYAKKEQKDETAPVKKENVTPKPTAQPSHSEKSKPIVIKKTDDTK